MVSTSSTTEGGGANDVIVRDDRRLSAWRGMLRQYDYW